MDLDAILRRKPDVVLVDELAHTNAPGSRNEKRWKDVEEILAAGISVMAAVNVQHLEGVQDVVGSVTGIEVRERLPDRIVRDADALVVVDLPVEELRERIRVGKVYAPEKAEQALANFFTEEKLTRLRELTLFQTADHIEADAHDSGTLEAPAPAGPRRRRDPARPRRSAEADPARLAHGGPDEHALVRAPRPPLARAPRAPLRPAAPRPDRERRARDDARRDRRREGGRGRGRGDPPLRARRERRRPDRRPPDRAAASPRASSPEPSTVSSPGRTASTSSWPTPEATRPEADALLPGGPLRLPVVDEQDRVPHPGPLGNPLDAVPADEPHREGVAPSRQEREAVEFHERTSLREEVPEVPRPQAIERCPEPLLRQTPRGGRTAR